MCGAVRYEVTEPLVSAGYCHCTRCQRRTGTAAAVSARIAPGSLRVTQGADAIKAYDPGGGGFHKEFCSVCGSSLFGGTWPDGPEVSVRLGALDEDPGIRPQYRSHTASTAVWDVLPDDGLPRFPRPCGRQVAKSARFAGARGASCRYPRSHPRVGGG